MPTPDENVHPTATGLAKQTVDAHQDPQEIVFWSAWVGIHAYSLVSTNDSSALSTKYVCRV